MTCINKPDDVNKTPTNPDYEIAKQLIGTLVKEVRQLPSNKQMLVSAATGWILGFWMMKIGRTVALAVGGGLILLQMAHDGGYITVNWDQVKNNWQEQAVDTTFPKRFSLIARKQTSHPIQVPNWLKSLVRFSSENMTISVGMLGGFLMGLATY